MPVDQKKDAAKIFVKRLFGYTYWYEIEYIMFVIERVSAKTILKDLLTIVGH